MQKLLKRGGGALKEVNYEDLRELEV